MTPPHTEYEQSFPTSSRMAQNAPSLMHAYAGTSRKKILPTQKGGFGHRVWSKKIPPVPARPSVLTTSRCSTYSAKADKSLRWRPLESRDGPLTLRAYNYTMVFRAGKLQANADALSRLPLKGPELDVPTPGDTVLMLQTLDQDNSAVSVASFRNWIDKDPLISRVREAVSQGNW